MDPRSGFRCRFGIEVCSFRRARHFRASSVLFLVVVKATRKAGVHPQTGHQSRPPTERSRFCERRKSSLWVLLVACASALMLKPRMKPSRNRNDSDVENRHKTQCIPEEIEDRHCVILSTLSTRRFEHLTMLLARNLVRQDRPACDEASLSRAVLIDGHAPAKVRALFPTQRAFVFRRSPIGVR